MARKIGEEERKKAVREVLDSSFPDDELVRLGENRGQLFFRIPQKLSKRLKLKKTDKMLIKVKTISEGQHEIRLEVVKDGTS